MAFKATFKLMSITALISVSSLLFADNAPQVMMGPTSSQSLQQQKQNAQAAKVILAKINDFVRNPNTPVQNPKGKVALIEFFDYQCSACHMMYPGIEQVIKANPDLRVVYKDLPIFGGASVYAAKGSFAAYQQSPALYLKYHDALFTSNKMEGQLTIADVDAMAKKVGLNMAKFHQAINAATTSQKLQNSIALAQSLQLVGTPALIILPTNATSNTPASQIDFVPHGLSVPDLQQAINQAAS